MSISVKIPTPLRALAGGARELAVAPAAAPTVADLLAELEARCPGIRSRLCDADGELLRFVNLFVDGEDVRLRQGLATPLRDGDEVHIVPAVSGGRLLESR